MNTFSGNTPTIGSRVLTSDGEELGKVKEVIGDCFKVDVRMQPDYWLGIDTVSSSTGGEVRLRFPKDGIKVVLQEGPDHKGFHPHNM
jgi:hypothetical protein